MAAVRGAPLPLPDGIPAGIVSLSALRRAAKAAVVLAALAVAVVPWVFAVEKLASPERIAPPAGRAEPQPHSVVWANRVFSSRAALTSWLSARGATYERWAKLHRADAAIVEHLPAPLKPPAAKAPAQRAATPDAQATPSSGSGGSLAWAQVVLVVLAAMAMVFSAAPAAVLVRVLGVHWLSTTRRTYLFTLGLSVCVGVLIAGGHL
jgi:hypothetical protein